MDFEPNEIQEMIRSGASRFASEIDCFDAQRACDQALATKLWAAFVEMGWNGIQAPESAGGFGGNPEDLLVLLAEIGSGSSAAFMINNIILPSFLLDAAESALARNLLAKLVAGDLLISAALFEPGSGYALHAPGTLGRKNDGSWLLSGAKTRVVSGLTPQSLIVNAAIEDGSDIGLFVVNLGEAGVTSSLTTLIDGTPVLDITFENVKVGDDAVLLLAGGASEIIEDGIGLATFCCCAAALGCMKRALAMTADYLKVREQFGRSLASFQSLQHRVSDMFIAMDDAHSSLFQAMAAMGGSPRARRRAIAGCAVKVIGATKWVTGEAVHLHGGIGFTSEHEIGHLYQKGVTYGRLFGDANYHFERYVALSGP